MLTLRAQSLDRLKGDADPQVVVLGGGIHGAAVLRDLALNGVGAVLLDTSDFCAGATGASTRMAHGGLRYLENREFALVAEAARERNLLLRHAPHAVVPVKMMLPMRHMVRGFFGAAGNFLGLGKTRVAPSALTMKAALSLYEWLDRKNQTLPRHRVQLNARGLLADKARRFRHCAHYWDGRFSHPEGLVFELIQEALENHPSCAALNHVGWVATPDGITLDDIPSLTLAPKIIINATGPHVDDVNALLFGKTDYVSVVRGAHLVIDHPDLRARLRDDVWYFDDGAGRMIICYGLGDMVLVGTTEIPCKTSELGQVRDEEKDYLLTAIASLFDDLELDSSHIVATTTGGRALKSTSGKDAYHAARSHELLFDQADCGAQVLSMVGGKWTTFRAFAELATDQVLGLLGEPRTVDTRSRGYLGTPTDESGPRNPRTQTLAQRYGALGERVAEWCLAGDDTPLETLPDYTKREVLWLIHARGARTVDDLVHRRMTIGLEAPPTQAARAELSDILREAADVVDRGHLVKEEKIELVK